MQKECDETEMSWLQENNTDMCNIIESPGVAACRRYRIYQRDLD